MKKIFCKPEIEIITFNTANIVAASPFTTGDDMFFTED